MDPAYQLLLSLPLSRTRRRTRRFAQDVGRAEEIRRAFRVHASAAAGAVKANIVLKSASRPRTLSYDAEAPRAREPGLRSGALLVTRSQQRSRATIPSVSEEAGKTVVSPKARHSGHTDWKREVECCEVLKIFEGRAFGKVGFVSRGRGTEGGSAFFYFSP